MASFRKNATLPAAVMVFSILSGCAAVDVEPISAPGLRPDPSTDEAGIWQQADKRENNLKTSALIERSPDLNAYVSEVVCTLAADHCADMRVYIVKAPFFNASMAPNGLMEVWTGLLLRSENEAQMAFVLGHEITHYLERHSLERWRTAKANAGAAMGVSVLLAGAGAGFANVFAQLGLIASLSAYTRDHERAADKGGLELMAAAGYNSREAARSWELLLAEAAASDIKENRTPKTSVFATHPIETERIDTLKTLAAANPGGSKTGAERYQAMVEPIMLDLLTAELQRRDYGQTLHLIDRLSSRQNILGRLHFARGEVYGRRNADGDDTLQIAEYRRAIAYPDAPPAAWRELGQALRKAGDRGGARAAFETYLEKAPSAPDAEFVRAYIAQLNEGNAL